MKTFNVVATFCTTSEYTTEFSIKASTKQEAYKVAQQIVWDEYRGDVDGDFSIEVTEDDD